MDSDQMESISVTLPKSLIAYLDKKASQDPEENRSKLVRRAVRILKEEEG